MMVSNMNFKEKEETKYEYDLTNIPLQFQISFRNKQICMKQSCVQSNHLATDKNTSMVIADNGLPEPDNPNEEFRVSNEGVILVTDDDSDQEPGGREYGQYQPLPSSPIEESTDTSDEDRENEVVSSSDSHSASSAFPPITPAEEILVKEVWSGPPPKSSDIEMNSEKIDIVKEAMANITLPPGSIPEWAASIPEEDWRQQLFKRLEDMREKKT